MVPNRENLSLLLYTTLNAYQINSKVLEVAHVPENTSHQLLHWSTASRQDSLRTIRKCGSVVVGSCGGERGGREGRKRGEEERGEREGRKRGEEEREQ